MHRVSANDVTGVGRRKRDLERRLRELTGSSGKIELLQVETFADPIDQVVSNADREIAGQRLDSEARWIHDIEAALGKLKNGGYGECESCEEPIGARRLDAIPWARLCVACQSAVEAHGNPYEAVFDQAA
jgi:DnaK suppressor protein